MKSHPKLPCLTSVPSSPLLSPPRYGLKGHEIVRDSAPDLKASKKKPKWTVPITPKTLFLQIYTNEGLDKTFTRDFLAFGQDTLQEIQRRIALKFDVPADKIRIWDYSSNYPLLLEDPLRTLDKLGLNGPVLVEFSHPCQGFLLLSVKNFSSAPKPSSHASSFVDLPSTKNIEPEAVLDTTPIDHTILIDYPHHKFDLTLQHGLSGTSWILPSQIADQLGIAPETLASTIKNSNLPESSIDAFIRYLCLSTPDPRPDRLSIVKFSHFTHLLTVLGLDKDHLFNDLRRAVSNMPYEDAIHGLLDVWTDDLVAWDLEQLFIHVVVARIRLSRLSDTFTEISTTRLSKRVLPLCMFVSSSDALIPCPEDPAPREWRPAGPTEEILKSTAISSFHSSAHEMTFVMKLDEVNSVRISESLVVLLPQWLWIRRMFETGVSEAKTRVCHLPTTLTSRAFLAILRALRGYRSELEQEDALVLLEHASELDLSTLDGAPVEPFSKLLSRARDICFPEITKKNCLANLEGYRRLRMKAELKETLKFVVSVMHSLTGDQIFKISPDLYKLIHERVKYQQQRSAKNKN